MSLTEERVREAHEQFSNGALLGSVHLCVEAVDNLRTGGLDILEVLDSVVAPVLRTISQRWEAGDMRSGQEQMARAVCRRVVRYLCPPVVHGLDEKRRVLLLCAPGNRHQLGPEILGHLLENEGFYSDLLHASTPADEVLDFARFAQPKAILLSLSHREQMDAAGEQLCVLRQALPDSRLLVSGPIVATHSRTADELAAQHLRETLDTTGGADLRAEVCPPGLAETLAAVRAQLLG